jgi:hypothetical protein
MKDSCQRQTQVFDFPVTAMIADVPSPSLFSELARHVSAGFLDQSQSLSIAKKIP